MLEIRTCSLHRHDGAPAAGDGPVRSCGGGGFLSPRIGARTIGDRLATVDRPLLLYPFR
jgi:hypothetical protein